MFQFFHSSLWRQYKIGIDKTSLNDDMIEHIGKTLIIFETLYGFFFANKRPCQNANFGHRNFEVKRVDEGCEKDNIQMVIINNYYIFDWHIIILLKKINLF